VPTAPTAGGNQIVRTKKNINKMKKKLICKSLVDFTDFSLYLDASPIVDATGDFIVNGDGTKITICADNKYDAQVVLLHELQELYMLANGFAFIRSGRMMPDCSSERTFMFGHNDYANMIHEVWRAFFDCSKKLVFKEEKK